MKLLLPFCDDIFRCLIARVWKLEYYHVLLAMELIISDVRFWKRLSTLDGVYSSASECTKLFSSRKPV